MNPHTKQAEALYFGAKGTTAHYGVGVKELIKKFIPSFLLGFYHFSWALIGAFLYRFPSREMVVIGVTGTSGKSTVVELTARIFEETGYKVASLSSIKFKIGKQEWENRLKMTMPGRMKLQKFLRQALRAGCKYVVLEITSEGIKQYRHKFIDFDAAVFTNLSPEHIESHKGFENYRKAKLKLFKSTKKIHIINLDDKNAKYFLEIPAGKKYGHTMNSKQQTASNKKLFIVRCSSFSTTEKHISFEVQNRQFNLNLLGKFNIYNALAAICVGLSQGISLESCKIALEKVKEIPGRMEIVVKNPFTVIVDYAHTPEALLNVYKTLNRARARTQNSKLVCVLGACGGGRDKWKRPVLGKLAAEYCREIIVTNEDPYDENPMEIINQVASGVESVRANQPDSRRKSAVLKILDRRKAIRKALELAEPDDVVIITGKGCEPWLCVEKGKKIPWDDRQIVREEFKNRKNLTKLWIDDTT